MERKIQKKVQASLLKIRQATCCSVDAHENNLDSMEVIDSHENNLDSVDVFNDSSSSSVTDSPPNYLISQQITDDLVDGPVLGIELEAYRSITVSKKSQLVNWALTHNVTHSALSDLLGLIRNWLPNDNFPVDPRTLVQSPKQITLVPLGAGEFFHFGITPHINSFLNQQNLFSFSLPKFDSLNCSNLLTITIGIDGLLISKSSTYEFWPILGRIDQDKTSQVFVISLYCGLKKPDNIESFLGPFVNEMNSLEQNGLQFNNTLFNIRIRCIVADAPARSFVKNIKTHNAYFGCERCYRRGKWYRNRVTYPIKNKADAYTNDSYRQRWYQSHHKGTSPLEILKLDMIFQIPLDYMHLVCLGIMKKLLTVWVEGPLPHKLSVKQVRLISNKLEAFRKYIPSNFSRKCRGLDQLRHFKATEYRTFLLYIGPFSLKRVLTTEKFDHFLHLHTAMYILATETQSNEWLNFAEQLIDKFVSLIPKLYYKEMMVYNFHSLTHITDEVRIHGCLDRFSAFEFESFMQKIKRLLRSNSCHLSQVVNGLEEITRNNFNHTTAAGNFTRGKSLSINDRDNCYLTDDGRYCIIKCFNPLCVQYLDVCDIKWYKTQSSKLGVCKVLKLCETVEIHIIKLRRKCMFLRKVDSDLGYIVPLCNSDCCK